MPKPLEQLAEVFWDALLRQIESKIQERVEAAIAAQLIPLRMPSQEPETASWDKPGAHFISTRDLITMTGLSRSTINNLENAGQFPRRVKLTKYCVRYKVDEIREWEKSVVDAGRITKRRLYERDAKDEAERTEKLIRFAAKRIPKAPEKPLPYYRMRDIMRMAGMTHSQVYDAIREVSFPRSMESGHRGKQRWDRKGVDAWLANRSVKKEKEKINGGNIPPNA